MRDDERCPSCGCEEQETETSFGGFFRKVCKKCKRLISEGRQQPVEA